MIYLHEHDVKPEEYMHDFPLSFRVMLHYSTIIFMTLKDVQAFKTKSTLNTYYFRRSY